MPRISVVVPAYYSTAALPACLEALRAQTERDFEVLVVNSSPEEETGRLVRERFPEVRFEQSPVRLLPHAARNRGVELSRGELLVFTDPDCTAAPDWLARLTAACARGRGAAGGSIVLARAGWVARGIHGCKFPYQQRGAPPGPTDNLPTANACYTRELWADIGPFDSDLFCGDSLLSGRAAAIGRTPVYEPGAVVHHEEHAGLQRFLRERYARGREVGRTRAQAWSRPRAAILAALAAPRVAKNLARVARAAARAGELGGLLATFPVHVAGQLAWILGESAAFAREAARRRD